MEKNIQQELEKKLETGEKLLWCGTAEPGKIFTKVYTPSYLLAFIISYGICAFVFIKSIMISAAGGDAPDLASLIMILVVCSILPATIVMEAKKAHGLIYGATDRRLITMNSGNVNSVPYVSIHEAHIKKDSDGYTSLLCGKNGVLLKENKWRGVATLNCTSVSENQICDHFVLYAVNDIKGLKNAVLGKIPLSS